LENKEITMTHVAKKLQKLGWYECSTGGGCTAFSLKCCGGNNPEETEYLLLTDDGGLNVPTRANQKIILGYYDKGGEQKFTIFMNLRSILNGSCEIIPMGDCG
jgi:hypothetical protein